MDLDGKVAIVTGASRGVRRGTAMALAAAGTGSAARHGATDAQPLPIPSTIDATVRTIVDGGGRALALPTNLADDEDVVAMVTRTVDAFGPVDILVNNAAITFPGDLDLPMKRHDLIFAVQHPRALDRGRVPWCRESATRGEGAILNVSSLAGLNYFPGQMAYGMSKAALEHMTVCLAAQLRVDRIAVNTFRIDVPVASEGFVYNSPGVDTSDWEPCEGRGRGHPLGAPPAAGVHGPQRGDGRTPRGARDHAQHGTTPRITAASG